jgi:hypothetical protein
MVIAIFVLNLRRVPGEDTQSITIMKQERYEGIFATTATKVWASSKTM